MEWISILGLLVVAIGWFAVHILSKNRDLEMSMRAWRLKQLEEAYFLISQAIYNDPMRESDKELIQRAISKVHLFGTTEQVNLCNVMVSQITTDALYRPGPLIESLSNEVRELNLLDKLEAETMFLKFSQPSYTKDGL